MELWHVPLHMQADAMASALEVLDAGERARADRFRASSDRMAFVAAHAAMRHILAEASGHPPRTLAFVPGPAGKPRLANAHLGNLHFSLSHSADHALVVVCPGRLVGVDLEALPARQLVADDMEAVFSAAELAAIRALPPEAQALAILRCWVRKEALLKAVGCGLEDDVRRVTVSVSAEARLLASEHPQVAAGDWALLALESPGRWVGAIAAQDAATPIAPRWRQWRWPAGVQGLAA
ncbi:4'-phosphopantetheinyl transferase superfamily protein [Ramlibacter sp. AN1015]|uniref:4'-phosphopantetheinyl transferase family protein n=1 Tax=Ramlibacter sp. AN1015 TaxID=3133428 RepID=UPI0030C53334